MYRIIQILRRAGQDIERNISLINWKNGDEELILTVRGTLDKMRSTAADLSEKSQEWDDLKPCPFCGGTVRVVASGHCSDYCINCIKCGVDCEFEFTSTAAALVEKWNSR